MFKGKFLMNDIENLVVYFVLSFFMNFVGMIFFSALFYQNGYDYDLFEWIVDTGVIDYMILNYKLFYNIRIFFRYIYIIMFNGIIRIVKIVGSIKFNNLINLMMFCKY